MKFRPDHIIAELDRNQEVFKALLTDKTEKARVWKQSDDKWCLLEIVCHLYDEEVYDFRTRVKTQLESPGTTPPSIDPEGWVTERKYMEKEYSEMLHQFLYERKASIQWLNSLVNPQWDNFYEHPRFGPLSASYFLTNWLVHDQLHIKQITRLNYDYVQQLSDHNRRYAGKWV